MYSPQPAIRATHAHPCVRARARGDTPCTCSSEVLCDSMLQKSPQHDTTLRNQDLHFCLPTLRNANRECSFMVSEASQTITATKLWATLSYHTHKYTVSTRPTPLSLSASRTLCPRMHVIYACASSIYTAVCHSYPT